MARGLVFVAGIVAVAAAFSACSSGGGGGGGGGTAPIKDGGGTEAATGPTPDGSTSLPDDSGGTVGTDDANPRATACTAPPFVNFNATLTTLDVSGATGPAAGAKIGFTSCSGYELTTDATGKASTQITQGIALSPLYNAGVQFLSAVGAEIPATADVSPSVALFAFDVGPAIPGFVEDGGDAAVIAVVLQVGSGASGACDAVTGATLSVTGHPEAIVSYMATAWPTDLTVSTSGAVGPYVFIRGVTGANTVTVTGAKSGCSVTIADASQTGRFALLAGSVTIGVGTVGN